MNIRAKFKCVLVHVDGGIEDGRPFTSQEQVSFAAVTSDNKDNESWSKWTPSGSLSMVVTNPAAFGAFEEGKEYFLDLTPSSV